MMETLVGFWVGGEEVVQSSFRELHRRIIYYKAGD